MNNFKFFSGGVSNNNETITQLRIPLPFEPLRTNRFILTSNTFPIESNFIKSVNRPSYSIVNNHIVWDDFVIELYEPIAPSITQRIFDTSRTEGNGLTIHELKIEMLDPTGVVVQSWKIYGFIRDVNLGVLDYSNNDITNLTITFRVTHVELFL
jgi:hypothetical protein